MIQPVNATLIGRGNKHSARTFEASGCSALFSFYQIDPKSSFSTQLKVSSVRLVNFMYLAVLISFVVLIKPAVAKLQLALHLSVITTRL